MPDVVQQEQKANFLDDIGRLGDAESPSWLREVRQRGAQAFGGLPLPHRKQERWRFTDMSPLVETPFRSQLSAPADGVIAEDIKPFLFALPGWTELVFVDGFLNASLSKSTELPAQAEAGSLADAIKSRHELAAEYLHHDLSNRNIFAALNAALIQDGAFIYLPPACVLEQPVHLLFVNTKAGEPAASHPRNLVIAGENSQASLVETYVSLANGAPEFSNVVSAYALGAGARVEHCKVVSCGPETYHLATASVRQDRDSTFASHSVVLSGQIVRNQLDVTLVGPGAACQLHGLYLNDGGRLVDNALDVAHEAPHCSSRMAYRGILDDTSRAVFTGKVLVTREAQQTDSNQINNNLLLSDNAVVDTKPQLEIYADDVKCTHGATIGPPPEEQVFYFRSRGIPEDTARGMLTCGFAGYAVNRIPVEPLRKKLDAAVFAKYRPKQ